MYKYINIQNNPLKKKIIRLIETNGSMHLSEFMEICLYNYDYGYYSNSSVVGRKGDFITSPEISQVFGELISLNFYNNALLSNLKEVNLVELGPGNGTLMLDMLKTFSKIKTNHIQFNPFLYEKSDQLKKIQRKNLIKFKCNWINSLSDIPNKPTYFIANEFFDSLPINQFISNDGSWHERKIEVKNNDFCFVLGGKILDKIDDNPYPNGKIIEQSVNTQSILSKIFHLILENKGALIVIDYGQIYENLNYKNTLQGVKNHQATDVFQNIGHTDLSSWVNFSDFIKNIPKGIIYRGPITQKEFLINLGIKNRFEDLGLNKSASERRNLFNEFDRLVSDSHMGQAFKVLGMQSENLNILEGF